MIINLSLSTIQLFLLSNELYTKKGKEDLNVRNKSQLAFRNSIGLDGKNQSTRNVIYMNQHKTI